jgi:hypothetical protein
VSGWLSVQSTSVEKPTSTPGARAPSAARCSANPPSTARNSVSIRSHRSARAGSVTAAWLMMRIRSPARSLVRRDWRATARTSATGSSPASNSRYQARSVTAMGWSSPPRRTSHSPCSTPALVPNARYTVLSATPARSAMAGMATAA